MSHASAAKIVLSLAGIFSLTPILGCKPRAFNQSEAQSSALLPIGFRTVAGANEWGGQLLLPALAHRSEGSVYLKVAQSPDAHKALIGHIVKITWPKHSGSANKYRPTVNFDAKELAEAKKAGNIVPEVLSGWSSVSPLESLAAARCSGVFFEAAAHAGKAVSLCDYQPLDRIYVRLSNARFSDNQLVLSEDPIVVAGTHLTLIKQIQRTGRSEANGRFAVYRASVFSAGKFNDNDNDKIEFLVEEKFGSRPNFTFNNINSSPAGSQGWFLHGELDSGVVEGKRVFVAKAIEPRALLNTAGAFEIIENKNAGQQFIQYQENLAEKNEYLAKNAITRSKFESLENNFRRVRILPQAGSSVLSSQSPIKKTNYSAPNTPFKAGEKGLIVHLFHWISDSAGKKDVGPLGLVTGHYSYGFYDVVRESLTGELQFEVVYQQVYGQGPDAVISSRVSRTEYMGNFRRGWSNSIASSDVFVRTPWLNQAVDGPAGALNAAYTPYNILNDSLSLMTQAYRTGSGDGISSVTPWASCVQDSSQALFIALRQAEKIVASTRGANFCSNPDFKGLCNLVSALKKNFDAGEIFENAPVRGDWLNNALDMQIKRSSNMVENGYAALASYKTALPRHAFNLFVSTMLEQGMEIMLMDNVQIGGQWTASQRASTFTPVPATTIFEVVRSAIAKAKGNNAGTISRDEFVNYLLKAEGVNSLQELNHRFPHF